MSHLPVLSIFYILHCNVPNCERGYDQHAVAARLWLLSWPSQQVDTTCTMRLGRCKLACARSGGAPPGTPLRLLPSPLRPAGGGAALRTPSPVRLSASSFFATPGGVAAGTPISESLASTAWLRDLVARTPPEARTQSWPWLLPSQLLY